MDKILFPLQRLSLVLCVCFFLASFSSPGAATPPPVPEQKASIQVLTGLDRHYNLSFLWFDSLALGQLSFNRVPSMPNHYRAVLDAKTLGVAAWLTGDRVQHYETLMELTPQGRFQTLEYKSMIKKKKGNSTTEQAKVYTFNPANRSVTMTRTRDGKKGAEKALKVQGDRLPVDFLTAGFNFILGADGPIRGGERKEIVTITSDGEQKILIEVLNTSSWPKTSFFRKGSGTLLKITLPTEVLDTGGGSVYALLDEKLLPQRVIVENVLGLGEVRGELRP